MRYRASTIFKKHSSSRARHERGFELVEIVLASGIISLTLVSIIVIASRSIIISRRSISVYTASTLLEEGAEVVRSIRDGGWLSISSLSEGTDYYPVYNVGTGVWTLDTAAGAGTPVGYTRSIVMSAVNRDAGDDIVSTGGADDPGTKRFVETVSWKEGDGSSRSKKLSFYLSDIF